jgi:hypothetical protein
VHATRWVWPRMIGSRPCARARAPNANHWRRWWGISRDCGSLRSCGCHARRARRWRPMAAGP